jgi:hypothetical protein
MPCTVLGSLHAQRGCCSEGHAGVVEGTLIYRAPGSQPKAQEIDLTAVGKAAGSSSLLLIAFLFLTNGTCNVQAYTGKQ